MISKKIFYIFILISNVIFSQTKFTFSNDFEIKIKSGIMFQIEDKYLFLNYEATRIPFDMRYISIKPGYSIGIGFETLHLINISDSYLNVNLELNYGNSSTGKVKLLSDNVAEMNYKQLTSLVWFKIINSGIITPYLRIGFGINQKYIKETHTKYPLDNSKFSQLLFCMGISSGINYHISDNLSISLYVDAYYTNSGKKEILENYIFYDFSKKSGSIITGFEFGYNF